MADRAPLSVAVTTRKSKAAPVKLHISSAGSEVSGPAEPGPLLGAEVDRTTLDRRDSSSDQPGSTQQVAADAPILVVRPLTSMYADALLTGQLQQPTLRDAEQAPSSDAALTAEKLHVSADEKQQSSTSAIKPKKRSAAAEMQQTSSSTSGEQVGDNAAGQRSLSSAAQQSASNAEEKRFPTAEEQQPRTIPKEWQPLATFEQKPIPAVERQKGSSSSVGKQQTPSLAEQLALSDKGQHQPFPTAEEQQPMTIPAEWQPLAAHEQKPKPAVEQQQGSSSAGKQQTPSLAEQLASSDKRQQQTFPTAEKQQPLTTAEEWQPFPAAVKQQSSGAPGVEQQGSAAAGVELQGSNAPGVEQQGSSASGQQQLGSSAAGLQQPSAAFGEAQQPLDTAEEQHTFTSSSAEKEQQPWMGQQQSSTSAEEQPSSTEAQQQSTEEWQTSFTAQQQQQAPASEGLPLTGQSCLLIAQRPSALVSETAQLLARQGAQVTLALRHPQDSQLLAQGIAKCLPEGSGPLLHAQTPLNLGSLASIRGFAAALNASPASLDLLLLHGAECRDGRRRWYTTEGISGAAQTGFLGPAYLLYLLQPKLAACSTRLLLTASPLHRLGRLDDVDALLHDWAGAGTGDSQLALLAYARQLAGQLKEYGVTAAAVDVGILREQPLSGSLLRKLPPMHQLLQLLLPASSDSARLLASVAGEELASKPAESTADAARPVATAAAAEKMEGLSAGGAGEQQQGERVSLSGAGPVGEAAAQEEARGGTSAAGAVEAHSGHAGAGEQPVAGGDLKGEPTAAAAGEGEAAQGPDEKQASQDNKRLAAAAEHPAGAMSDDWEAQQAAPGDAWGQGDRAAAAAAAGGEVAAQEPAEVAAAAAAAAGDDRLPRQLIKTVGTTVGAVICAAVDAVRGVAAAGSSAAAGGLQAAGLGGGGRAGRAPAAAGAARGSPGGPPADNFRYISRGLLATPLLTSLDLSGRSSWVTRALSSLAYPAYQLSASSAVYSSMLLDWPARAWLLGPAGVATGWTKAVFGARAAAVTAWLQRTVPGIEGVHQAGGWDKKCAGSGGGGVSQWVEVAPAGLVWNEAVGQQLWQLVNEVAGRA